MIAVSSPNFSYRYQPFCLGYRSNASQTCRRARFTKRKIIATPHMLCQAHAHAMLHVPSRSRRRPRAFASTSDIHLAGSASNKFGTVPELLSLMRRMVVFLLPLTALVLSEPLLVWCTSLFIGQFGTISELAALGPANIVIGE